MLHKAAVSGADIVQTMLNKIPMSMVSRMLCNDVMGSLYIIAIKIK
jgi:hypothetical protein